MSAGFWETCLSRFEQDLPSQQFNTWIRPLRLEGEDANTLRLLAPNGFILKWVRERYLACILECAETFFGAPVQLTLGVKSAGSTMPAHADQDVRTTRNNAAMSPAPDTPAITAPPSPAKKKAGTARTETAYDRTRLRPELTFDNLVVGKGNDLARAAAFQVAQNPGGAYNPLFIYGGAGLGKTHLIHAIGNSIAGALPEKVVRYVHAEDYYSDVVKAYQQKSFDVFKRYYRSLDILLLDDVQFFNGKTRSQEEFFFAFNALFEARKQIIITCDTYPKDINGLDDRLVTRFDWGLTVQIEPPELEMRVAILKKKAGAARLNLGDDVAFFIARHLKSNVRELEGALKNVLAYSTFRNVAVTLEVAREALKDIIGSVRNVTIDGIQKTVADYYKIKVGDLFSKKRTRAIARPRQIAMWLSKELTSFSYPMIGDAFGGRDHTTVIHAVKTINSLKDKDDILNHDLHVLTQVLKG
ncbi:MAG: chromosomal replication initiator protein DnaA [Zoogloeaceae bacterium]|jgi:chromosomal replication initiator protein|nr:chromosomal replication initiator protein DnaA [Zoogloeaceae bacterium]